MMIFPVIFSFVDFNHFMYVMCDLIHFDSIYLHDLLNQDSTKPLMKNKFNDQGSIESN